MSTQNKPILYIMNVSPAARSVKLVAAAIGLEIEERVVDLLAGEQMKEEFLKVNPQHVVPTLDDNGKILWDSHAISTYLVSKFAKDDSLYPKDLYTRARVDQRLHFDSSVLWDCIYDCNWFIFLGGSEVPAEKIAPIHKAYDLLESFFNNDHFLVGNSVTVADLCVVNSITTLQYHAALSPDKHPKILAWLDRVTKLSYYYEQSGKHIPGYYELLKKHNWLIKNEVA